MLIQMLASQPQMLGTVLKNTPPWVWGLLAGLIVLGLSQARHRVAGLARITITPVAMTGLAVWGVFSAFGASALLGYCVLAWLCAAAVTAALLASGAPARGTHYDSVARRFALPGSWVPMALIMGIFLTKYLVGVELAMRPALAQDGQYSVIVAGLYGLFSGIFIGRAARLLRLAYRPALRSVALHA
jgi:hypothetical protein